MNLNSEPIIKTSRFCVGSHQDLHGKFSVQGQSSALDIATNDLPGFRNPEFFMQDIIGISNDQEKYL